MTVALPDTMLVRLAVNSGSNGSSILASFDSVSIVTSSSMRLSQDLLQTPPRIAPNPAQDRLLVSLEQVEIGMVTITLMDVQGRQIMSRREVLEAGTHSLKMNLSQVPTGLYLIRIDQNGQQWINGISVGGGCPASPLGRSIFRAEIATNE